MAMRCSRPILVGLALAAVCGAHTFHGDNARTGYLSEGITLPLTRLHSVDAGALVVSSPCVVGDTVFIGSRDSAVYCIRNGTVRWRFETGGWVDATPAYAGGRIYAGSRDGVVYILDAATGDSLGALFNGSAQSSSPLVYDSLVIFGSGGWSQDIRAQSIAGFDNNSWFFTNRLMVHSSPALAGDIVVYGENGGSINALRAGTGEHLWTYQTSGGVYLSTPAIADDTVFFSPGEYDKALYAFTLREGTLVWKNVNRSEGQAKAVNSAIAQQMLRHSPDKRRSLLAHYQKLYKMRRSEARALEQLTVTRDKATAFTSLGGNATSSVAVDERNVYVVHMEYGYPKPRFTLTAFDKSTGAQQWDFSELRNCTQLGFCSSPLVVDSLVIVGWGEGKLHALNARNGTKMWEDSVSGDILSSPSAGMGKLHVATTSGQVITYGLEDMAPQTSAGTYCYPNPARGDVSHIRIQAAKTTKMTLVVYNTAEKPVFRVTKGLAAGEVYTHDWDLKGVANGAYVALVTFDNKDGTKDKTRFKIAILK